MRFTDHWLAPEHSSSQMSCPPHRYTTAGTQHHSCGACSSIWEHQAYRRPLHTIFATAGQASIALCFAAGHLDLAMASAISAAEDVPGSVETILTYHLGASAKHCISVSPMKLHTSLQHSQAPSRPFK